MTETFCSFVVVVDVSSVQVLQHAAQPGNRTAALGGNVDMTSFMVIPV